MNAFDNRRALATITAEQPIVIVDRTISDDGRDFPWCIQRMSETSFWPVDDSAGGYLHDARVCVVPAV
jgi:hypothetical protein